MLPLYQFPDWREDFTYDTDPNRVEIFIPERV